MSDLHYWVALNSLRDIGPILTRRLLSAFGSAEHIFSVSRSELRGVEGVGEGRAQSICGFNEWDRIQEEIEQAVKNNIQIITINNRAYPETLKRIHGAPLVLYLKGGIADADKYAVAIVGSRNSTQYGMQVAEKMAYKLAASGLTVVSGMARGIDTAAHKGALRAGGRTIAVLGSGVDVPYPASNRGLMNAIASRGAVVSEFALGTQPKRENFPVRNRIISALSLGVIVVEATLDSGSLITVGYALEQGKDVFAVPGNITAGTSSGTNNLIKKGAKLIENAEEVIEELSPQIKGILREERLDADALTSGLTAEEKKIFSFMSDEPKHVDSLIRETEMTTGKALSVLLKLELKGIIRQIEGKNFTLN